MKIALVIRSTLSGCLSWTALRSLILANAPKSDAVRI